MVLKLTPLREPPEQIISLIEEKLRYTERSNILLIGAKGSIARGTFTPLSDIDLVVIVTDGTEHYNEFMYGTTLIEIRFVSLTDALRDIRKINIDWPLRVGSLLHLSIHYEREHTYEKLISEYKHTCIQEEEFIRAIDLHRFTEYYSKAYRAYKDNMSAQLMFCAMNLIRQFALIIALLNKNYFSAQGPEQFIEQISGFTFQPTGWKEAFEQSISRDMHESMKGIHHMWMILQALAKQFNFTTKRIETYEDITFSDK